MSSTKAKMIGIIGGGQLGQMMAISAIYMGHKVVTLDPTADCPASRVSDMIVADYDDVEALRELAERCDVLTYEFENVDADGLDAVVKDHQLPQGTDLLRISQNRIFEKNFLAKKAGVQVAPYKVVTSSLDIENLDFSKTHVLKTATGGSTRTSNNDLDATTFGFFSVFEHQIWRTVSRLMGTKNACKKRAIILMKLRSSITKSFQKKNA